MINSCHLDLVLYRGVSELRAEANRSYLGIVWWVMEPLLYVGVFYLVFDLGLRRGGDGFVPYLLCGLVPWKWFEGTVRSASTVLPASVGLMGQLYLPKYLLPLAVTVTNTLKFFIILGILLVFLSLMGTSWLSSALPWLLFLFAAQLALILGVGGLAAALVPLLPDLRYVVTYGLTMLFFMSGIFFSLADLSPQAQFYLAFNPMLHIIDGYRAVLLHGQTPDLASLGLVTLASAAMVGVAALLFGKFDRIYPRVIG